MTFNINLMVYCILLSPLKGNSFTHHGLLAGFGEYSCICGNSCRTFYGFRGSYVKSWIKLPHVTWVYVIGGLMTTNLKIKIMWECWVRELEQQQPAGRQRAQSCTAATLKQPGNTQVYTAEVSHQFGYVQTAGQSDPNPSLLLISDFLYDMFKQSKSHGMQSFPVLIWATFICGPNPLQVRSFSHNVNSQSKKIRSGKK